MTSFLVSTPGRAVPPSSRPAVSPRRSPFSPRSRPRRPFLSPAAASGAPTPPPPPPDPVASIPSTLPDLAAQAAAALDAGLGGVEPRARRLRITLLVPGLNPVVENTAPFNEALLVSLARDLAVRGAAREGRTVALLFASAGAAAAAARQYKNDDETVLPDGVLVSVVKAREVRRTLALVENPGDVVLLVVAPKNLRGDSVILDIEELLQEFPDAACVLLNPDLENTPDSMALSIREIERRRAVAASFQDVFYFRPLFRVKRPSLTPVERGLLLRRGLTHSPWLLFSRDTATGKYTLQSEFQSLPSRDEITGAFDRVKSTAALQTNYSDDHARFVSAIVGAVLVAVAFSLWFYFQ